MKPESTKSSHRRCFAALKIPRGARWLTLGRGARLPQQHHLARRVGPKGTILATDVQPQLLEMIKNNARDAGVTNIKPLLATQTDTKLPDAQVDLILMVDVYPQSPIPK